MLEGELGRKLASLWKLTTLALSENPFKLIPFTRKLLNYPPKIVFSLILTLALRASVCESVKVTKQSMDSSHVEQKKEVEQEDTQ